MNKSLIRQQVRQLRRNLTPATRRQAAHRLLAQLRHFPHFQYSQHIAIYLTNDGEIDTSVLIQDLTRRGKTLYLPVVLKHKKGHLSFIRWQAHSRMQTNRFGIQEPVFTPEAVLSPRFLELICMPLVAFDRQGNRLGMGGGFYDRTLAGIAQLRAKPALLGLAYELQCFAELPTEPWDIPLDAIATDAALYRFA